MRRALTFVVCTLALAAVVHVATVWAIPRVIMSKVFSGIGGNAGVNTFISPPLATAKSRTIVRPSPDLAYSICILDLSKGPVRVEVPLTEPYTSAALYSATSDNFYVRSDRNADGKPIEFIVTAPGAARPTDAPATVDVVASPTAKSLVLVRRVVASKEAFVGVDEVRKKSVCAPFKG